MPYCVKGICRPCPAGHFLKDKNCLVCKEIGFETGVSRENCHACENMFLSSSNWCWGCGSGDPIDTSLEECQRCSRRHYNPSDLKCYLCPNGQKASSDGLSCINE